MKPQVECFIKAITKFNKTIKKAGGSGFSLEDLESMSALSLIEIISTNDIEFKYTGLSVEKQKND